MHKLAQRVLRFVRRHELLHAGDRVGIAVSGGIDSVALLRLVLELRSDLGIVGAVVHFNHKLRGPESEADAKFVEELASEFDLEFFSGGAETAQYAAEKHLSVEAAARELRYEFFESLLMARRLDKICTGHTLDDQAETVLMRVVRGTGLRGLGAIHPRIVVEDENGEQVGEIVRPLNGIRRKELGSYLREIGQNWSEDSTNADDKFTRNRVRHKLLPLLEKEFNPSVAGNLAELAEIARGEEEYWENEIAGWMGTAVQWFEPEWMEPPASNATKGLITIQAPGSAIEIADCHSRPAFDIDLQALIDSVPWLVVNGSLDRMWLLGEPLAVQRRVIKAMGEHVRLPLEFKHVEDVVRFASEDGVAGKELSLPLGWKVVRHETEVILVTPDLRTPAEDTIDYEYKLEIPGSALVREIGSVFRTDLVDANFQASSSSGFLIDSELIGETLAVRNWRPGDRYWPAHTKAPRKIKELLQERAGTKNLDARARKQWPVIVCGEEIICVRGFALCEKFRAKPGRGTVLITERVFGGEQKDGTKVG